MSEENELEQKTGEGEQKPEDFKIPEDDSEISREVSDDDMDLYNTIMNDEWSGKRERVAKKFQGRWPEFDDLYKEISDAEREEHKVNKEIFEVCQDRTKNAPDEKARNFRSAQLFLELTRESDDLNVTGRKKYDINRKIDYFLENKFKAE